MSKLLPSHHLSNVGDDDFIQLQNNVKRLHVMTVHTVIHAHSSISYVSFKSTFVVYILCAPAPLCEHRLSIHHALRPCWRLWASFSIPKPLCALPTFSRIKHLEIISASPTGLKTVTPVIFHQSVNKFCPLEENNKFCPHRDINRPGELRHRMWESSFPALLPASLWQWNKMPKKERKKKNSYFMPCWMRVFVYTFSM